MVIDPTPEQTLKFFIERYHAAVSSVQMIPDDARMQQRMNARVSSISKLAPLFTGERDSVKCRYGVIVAAMHITRAMGYRGCLPWPKNENDLREFRMDTMGHICIVGRRTYQSLPRGKLKTVLPGRMLFVVTKGDGSDIEMHPMDMVQVFSRFDFALGAAMHFDTNPRVIGGLDIYTQAMCHANVEAAHFTIHKGNYPGMVADTFWPDYGNRRWMSITWECDRNSMRGISAEGEPYVYRVDYRRAHARL